ncbi:MAG: DNA polymerase I [Acidimicrobiia bacterium]|nr:DNA polymerase I [Acidimicrobiia bacterium]
MGGAGAAVVEELRRSGVARGDLVALAVAPGVGLGLATPARRAIPIAVEGPVAVLDHVERVLRPRWVLWSKDTAEQLVQAGLRVAACWDIAAVHRLLAGGWRAEPARAWAEVHGLAAETIPKTGPLDLFSHAEQLGGALDEPVRRDGHLSPEWAGGGWSATPDRLARWAELASSVAALQLGRLGGLPDQPRAVTVARSESAVELLCAELSVDGLPMDCGVAEEVIAGFIGPRPRTEDEAAAQRSRRDAEVLRHAPPGAPVDLRSPGQVRSLLRQIGVEVPDTRAWRLEALRHAHPLVDAILTWRKAERMATTFGYAWLDENLGEDNRLRGAWSGCDGAAGRMTASAGLHNMPADLRRAVLAEPGHVFVRADLGQIEPRVLAAVSGDEALARAAMADDMYAPVARQLGVDRATAKVAVLGAMYGQTTGRGLQALHRLESAYPVAMAYLERADRAGQAGHDLRTYGGRLLPMGASSPPAASEHEARGRAAARGRYARNAAVQGAAAELFKVWAATVRARGAQLGAGIVLCLHDELLVHAPVEHGDAVARLAEACLHEAAHRWAPDDSVRFVADISAIPRWSDAKG